MLSSELEFCLNEAFQRARDHRHEFMTVEHLLLALMDIPAVHEILKSCDCNIPELRRQLTECIDEQTPVLPQEDDTEVQPTLGFQRVLQRAVFHGQASGKKEVTGSNVFVAIFSEKQSQAVYFLSLQDISRLDVVNFISHGMPQVPLESIEEDGEPQLDAEAEPEATPASASEGAPMTAVSALTETEVPNPSPDSASEAISLSCCVHTPAARTKTYAEPASLSSLFAPTTAVSPSSDTA